MVTRVKQLAHKHGFITFECVLSLVFAIQVMLIRPSLGYLAGSFALMCAMYTAFALMLHFIQHQLVYHGFLDDEPRPFPVKLSIIWVGTSGLLYLIVGIWLCLHYGIGW
jgi:hypothetical protein